MEPWDLGGDGKCYYNVYPKDETYERLMRK